MEKQQIVKAFECCFVNRSCEGCPVYAKDGCLEKAFKNALSLIREQEKRIEELENICESYVLQYGTATDKEVFLKKERADTVRKMQELLCEDRVSNDPVVIAVNVAANQLLEETT